MECQIVLFISLLTVSPIKAEILRPTPTINPSPSIGTDLLIPRKYPSSLAHVEKLRPTNSPPTSMKVENMLRPRNNPTKSSIPYNEAVIYITPRQQLKPAVKPNDTKDLKINDFYRQRQYPTNVKNIKASLNPNDKDLSDFKNLCFKTVTSRYSSQGLGPIQNNLYTTLNPKQTTAPTNLLDPGATKRDTGSLKEMKYSQKYQLIPYEFDTQGGILKEGPAILNSAFEIIIAPQKESVHQNQKDYYHIDNYFDFEPIAKEREKARLKAEIIAKTPLVLVQGYINNFKRIPVGTVNSVKVPLPSPFFVPLPERYPVPQPFVVPIEIIRPFTAPIIKTEKVEVERPGPVEVEKHIDKLPMEKKVFIRVDRPYHTDKFVPGKREVPYEIPVYNLARYSIVKHVYDHS